MKRFLKQLIYGIFYLALFGAFGSGIYILTEEPPPIDCNLTPGLEICELRSASIVQGEIINLPQSETTTIIIAEISNSSLKYGLSKIGYVFRIFSKFGPEMLKLSGSTSLYPGEKKYIFYPGINLVSSDIGEIDLSFDAANWQPVGSLPEKPVITLNKGQTKAEENSTTVEGTVASSAFLDEIYIFAAGIEALNGRIIGASSARVTGLSAGIPKPFKIFLPKDDYSRIDLYYEATVD